MDCGDVHNTIHCKIVV